MSDFENQQQSHDGPDQPSGGGHKGHPVKFQVNGEHLESQESDLTVRQVLELAEFTPVEEYQLSRDRDHEVLANYDQVVFIHDGDKFTALYLGPTPTS